jgi:hypothetical protein
MSAPESSSQASKPKSSGGMRRIILFAILGILIVLLIFDYTSRSSMAGAWDKLSEGKHFNEEEPEADEVVPELLLTQKQVHEKIGDPSDTYTKGDYTIDVYRWPGALYTYVMKIEYQGKGADAGAIKIRKGSVMRLVAKEDDVLPDFTPIAEKPKAAANATPEGGAPAPIGVQGPGGGGGRRPGSTSTPGVEPPGGTPPEEKKPGEEKSGEAKPGEEKSGEAKSGQEKAGDAKKSDEKAGEAKPGDETKPGDEKASDAAAKKPAEGAAEKKDDK